MRPRVAHAIHRVSSGGAGRALGFLTRTLTDFDHAVLQLDPGPGAGEARRVLAAADIVHVHFWNTPEMYELLDGDLPPMRMLLSPHVGGASAPHVLIPELLRLADMTVALSPYTFELPGLGDLPLVPAVAGWERMRGVAPVPHHGFNVGYVGTVDFAKMHPDFARLSAAVEAPDVRFKVFGAGRAFAMLARQADELGLADRLELHGWVEDVRPAFAILDVLGYPLAEDNYSATELVLQEAMYAGVPPVVLPYGGAARTVEHGRTGLVATDEDDYPRCIDALRRDPDLRDRLAAGARQHARRAWDPYAIAARWNDVYGRLLAKPKAERRAPLFGGLTGAELFARTLGHRAAEQLGSDEAIAAASPALLSADAGGILHYRRRFPADPELQRWAGLALLRRARAAA